MSNEPNDIPEKPEIIVDEDWKTQVEREKQEAVASENAAEASDANDVTSAPPAAQDEVAADESGGPSLEPGAGEMPPASFEIHVSSVATQVLVALGQIPDPIENKPRINLPFAKFQIDILEVLEEKTKGNLSIPENNMLKDALHQLRMMYVAIQEQTAK